MRRMSWLLLVLAGCTGDGDPVEVAERFQERLLERDDAGAHALLTDADRAAVPPGRFPAGLPDGIVLTVFSWGEAPLDSASLLDMERDTAAVTLHVADRGPDTLRLVATHHPIGLGPLELDRVRWRVSLGLAHRALLDSLAAAMQAESAASDLAGVAQAEAYLLAAEEHPAHARPVELAAARSLVRRAAVVAALGIELRVTESFTGTTVIDGRIRNPSRNRIATLRLIVRDGAGDEEAVTLWGVEPGSTTPVRQVTRLRVGPVTHRVERIQVY